MNEEKKVNEQIKEYIKQICESEKYDLSMEEFDVDVSFDVTKHFIKGTNICFNNEWDITYKTTLSEKNGKFHHSIYSSVHPKYIAAYAVLGYIEAKKKYEEEQQKKEEKEEENNKKNNKHFSFFDRLFGR